MKMKVKEIKTEEINDTLKVWKIYEATKYLVGQFNLKYKTGYVNMIGMTDAYNTKSLKKFKKLLKKEHNIEI